MRSPQNWSSRDCLTYKLSTTEPICQCRPALKDSPERTDFFSNTFNSFVQSKGSQGIHKAQFSPMPKLVNAWAMFQYKDSLSNSHYKEKMVITPDHLIFKTGTTKLVIQHLYIETAPVYVVQQPRAQKIEGIHIKLRVAMILTLSSPPTLWLWQPLVPQWRFNIPSWLLFWLFLVYCTAPSKVNQIRGVLQWMYPVKSIWCMVLWKSEEMR